MDMALGLGVIKWSACSPCDPRSNPADVSSFYVKFVFEKNENKQKGREWPIFEKNMEMAFNEQFGIYHKLKEKIKLWSEPNERVH